MLLRRKAEFLVLFAFALCGMAVTALVSFANPALLLAAVTN
jgi:hypothetical protein